MLLRSNGITCWHNLEVDMIQNVSISDGGQAIVGNVTQNTVDKDKAGAVERLFKLGPIHLGDGLGVDPALLQNLARQPFNLLSDRLVFGDGRRGASRRCGRLWHVILHGGW
jgi:hypothetical protein